MSTNQYRDGAAKAFKALTDNYKSSHWWRLGNSFDTMLDFLDTIDNSNANTAATTVVNEYQRALKNEGGYDNEWFDDFGWWTIATHRAIQKPYFSAEYKQQFRAFMAECWTHYTENAPDVWDRRKPGTFDACGPAVDGGVWNGYWQGTAPRYAGPKVADPTTGNLQGIQNTVTNALFLIAAQRFANENVPGARAAADREYAFLRQWLFLQPADTALWWPQGNGDTAALVRERAGHFRNQSKAAPGFQTNWAWTGDQGLLLGALTDRIVFRLDPSGDQQALKHAKAILEGARGFLVDQNGVLGYQTASGNTPDSDDGDYFTGTGVFWRYVLHAWRTEPNLRSFLNGADYRKFAQVNADAALAGLGSTDPDVLTNQLAILVAATVMLA